MMKVMPVFDFSKKHLGVQLSQFREQQKVNTSPTSSYQLNQQKLALLPFLFNIIISLAIIVGLVSIINTFFYIDLLAQHVPFLATDENYLSPEELLAQDEANYFASNQKRNQELNSNEVVLNATCRITKSSNLPAYAPLIPSNSFFWYEPSNCVEDFEGILVGLETEIAQIQNVKGIADLNSQTFEENPAYAFILVTQGTSLASLNQEISDNFNVLIPENGILLGSNERGLAVDTLLKNGERYFLTSECSNIQNSCELWKILANGENQKISDSLNQVEVDSETIYSLRFSAEQDPDTDIINLILVPQSQNINTFSLLRFSLERQLIVQRIELNKNLDAENYQRFLKG